MCEPGGTESSERPLTVYPTNPAARNQWILSRRPARNVVDPWRPYAFLAESELGSEGETVDVATVFLTNRECPWRCLMCDLWRNTLEETVPPGAIPAQIHHALQHLPPLSPERSSLKLYNAGSFFDPRAIPPADYPEIARLTATFRRTIVECHPAMVGKRCLEFRDLIPGRLEVAMGLETVHPEVLDRLNKRMTLDQFRKASAFLDEHDIDLRVFVLVRPPWLSEDEGIEWAKRSLDFAFDCGATVCALIPTRAGNGAMETLIDSGEFCPPALPSLEAVQAYGLSQHRGRVFVDLWDIDGFAQCRDCHQSRIENIQRMNTTQFSANPIVCSACASRGLSPEGH